VNLIADDDNMSIKETDVIESCYGSGMSRTPLLPGHLVSRMVSVRSPECISFQVVREIGLMDERLAPFTYDNHDYSLRCLKAGLRNYVYALKYVSDVEVGGMRQNPQGDVQAI